MTTFQLVAVPLLAFLVLITAVATTRRKMAGRVGAAWIALWLASATSIAYPGILVRLAHFLGIGRGADLVLYLAIFFGFISLFLIYLRFRRIDEQLTTLVRHLAITESERGEKAGRE